MKITTTETVPVPPPRIHTLELDDNELAILRYMVNYYRSGAAVVADVARGRFIDRTATNKTPVITSWNAAFGPDSKSE